jgi:hypothetical protein
MSKKDEYQEYVEEFMDDDDTLYKGGHTPSKQAENRTNSPNNKEVEYDWGKHPNSQKALKKHQFQKGVSGNQLGRPKTFDGLGKALKKMKDEIVTDWRNEPLGKRRKLVLERIWRDAQDGDFKKIQLLAWLGCLDDDE